MGKGTNQRRKRRAKKEFIKKGLEASFIYTTHGELDITLCFEMYHARRTFGNPVETVYSSVPHTRSSYERKGESRLTLCGLQARK